MSKRNNQFGKKKQVQRVPQVQIVNCKVEQVVRSIYFGFLPDQNPLKVRSTGGMVQGFYPPDEWVDVGIADAQGYRFMPESNSALITLGLHPSAVLLWLTQMRFDGQVVVRVQDDRLVALHGAVVQCARDMVFSYEKLGMVKGRPRVLAKPILDNYRVYVKQYGRPALFA